MDIPNFEYQPVHERDTRLAVQTRGNMVYEERLSTTHVSGVDISPIGRRSGSIFGSESYEADLPAIDELEGDLPVPLGNNGFVSVFGSQVSHSPTILSTRNTPLLSPQRELPHRQSRSRTPDLPDSISIGDDDALPSTPEEPADGKKGFFSRTWNKVVTVFTPSRRKPSDKEIEPARTPPILPNDDSQTGDVVSENPNPVATEQPEPPYVHQNDNHQQVGTTHSMDDLDPEEEARQYSKRKLTRLNRALHNHQQLTLNYNSESTGGKNPYSFLFDRVVISPLRWIENHLSVIVLLLGIFVMLLYAIFWSTLIDGLVNGPKAEEDIIPLKVRYDQFRDWIEKRRKTSEERKDQKKIEEAERAKIRKQERDEANAQIKQLSNKISEIEKKLNELNKIQQAHQNDTRLADEVAAQISALNQTFEATKEQLSKDLNDLQTETGKSLEDITSKINKIPESIPNVQTPAQPLSVSTSDLEEAGIDHTNMPNVAVISAGATIVATSPPFDTRLIVNTTIINPDPTDSVVVPGKTTMQRTLRKSGIFSGLFGGRRGARHIERPEVVLRPRPTLAACYPLSRHTPSQYITIDLHRSVVIDSVTVGHHPHSKQLSTPKDFSAYIITQNGRQEIQELFVSGQYNPNGTAYQTFRPTTRKNVPCSKVKFEFLSNYGDPDYTCIYQLRVHPKQL
ncbi:putative Sad1 / UNC-like C-terminal [Blattamonas nauphoetae]|uniref:Sad1 / UNC-like C-terminal n=1 Tax=Blattamonas nauphoetae TaxID=2049346 RepID=A0ABQ9YK48_9EUKA|nr:putative Sad1 / UNC-like C-terminal [Blattamonas nauphoetae]